MKYLLTITSSFIFFIGIHCEKKTLFCKNNNLYSIQKKEFKLFYMNVYVWENIKFEKGYR